MHRKSNAWPRANELFRADWLGLQPRQNSSGGKAQLGSITKRGDPHLRMRLVLGARSALMTVGRRTDRLSRWLAEVQQTRLAKGAGGSCQ
ncbi:IS110 family transposase [Burkholderia sp. LS-044]|uniref:transposase n=1 Tax=Burkholderia sp. LS-044 TaxID=1459967 RepID=UPI0010A5EF47|nr:transposase [Burkholderia sp. LS-044]THJ46025.1 IS110 family transposase [Burkholderia sp. LS-044]